MLGNERLAHDLRTVKVADGHSAVFEGLRGEESIGVTVLLNHALRDDPEDLGPNFTDGVLRA